MRRRWSEQGTKPIVYAGTYNGLYRSLNRGDHWTSRSHRLQSTFVLSLAVAPEQSTIFAGTASGIYRSRDLGSSWQKADEGLDHKFVTTLVFRPGARNTLYAGTNGGVFKTTDGGDHWTTVQLVPEKPRPSGTLPAGVVGSLIPSLARLGHLQE